MANSQPPAENVELLKSLYAAALHKYTTQTAEFVAAPQDELNRRKAEQQENKLYLDRLRLRLKDAGVSSGQIAAVEQAPVSALQQTEAALPQRVLQRAKTAILIMHGIGEQSPYETLDQFARNL